MELKTARLTLLIDPNKKAAFERLCAKQDRTASQVVRQLIRDYLIAHGVSYVASGAEIPDNDSPEGGAADRAVAPRRRKPPPSSKATSGRRR